MKIAIISGRYPHTSFKSYQNHKKYADTHGYTYISCCWEGNSSNPYFNKIAYIQHYIDLFDYIFWIDDDAFFLNFELDIFEFTNYSGQFLTICESPKYKKVWTFISSGQFLLRCDNDGKALFNLIESTDMGTVVSFWDESKYGFFTNGDQDVMVYVLENNFKNKYSIIPYHVFNSRIEDLRNGNEINLIHFTGKKEVKIQGLHEAMKILKLDDTLTKEFVKRPFVRRLLSRCLRKLRSYL
jgi:hypothetical protein